MGGGDGGSGIRGRVRDLATHDGARRLGRDERFAEDWVYDGAHERYVADEAMREKLRRSNPQAFRNVLRRMLEAAGRGMWNADDETLAQLRALYSETEDELEGVRTRP